MSRRSLNIWLLATTLIAAAAAPAGAQQIGDLAPKNATVPNFKPVTDAMLLKPDPADWLMWRRTYDGWGYSPLDQINKDNVKNLKVAWTWSLTPGATETTPIVHDGVLYVFNYADKVQAINGATGDLIWQYTRALPQKLVTEGGQALGKRNMAIYQDKLFVATSDAHIVALDAATGKVVWDHATGDWTKGWRYSGGPLIAHGKLIQGMTGCGNAEPGGCFVSGHDVNTGEELWRVWTIAHPGDPNEVDLERPAAREPLRRLGLDARQLRSRPEHRLFRHRPALSVDRRDARHAAEEGGSREQRALFGLHARHRSGYREAQVVPSVSAERHLGSRLRLRAHPGRSAGQRRDPQGAGDHRQARHHRGDRSRQRAMAVGEGDGAAERGAVLRSQDRREDHQRGRGSPYRPDHHQLSGRSRQPRLAGHRLQPEDADAVPAAQRVLLEDDAGAARSGPGLYGRRPRDLRSHQRAQQRRQYRARRCGQARRPQPGLVAPATLAGDQRHAADRRRRGVHRHAWIAISAPSTTPPARSCGRPAPTMRSTAFPITYMANGKQYVAVATGNGSSEMRSLNTLTPEIGIPDGGSVLWVFALPDK